MRVSRAPLKILYVEGNVDGTIGGSFYSLFYLVRGLDRQRFDPLVVFAAPNPMIPRFHAAGIETRVVTTSPPLVRSGPLGQLRSKVANFRLGFIDEPRRLAAMLREERVQLVHLNNSITSNHVWMLAARHAGIPCISHERGINDRYSTRSKLLGAGLAAVVCISEAVRQSLDRGGLGNLRLLTIPNGLDPADMVTTRDPAAIRAEFGIARDVPMVGLVGNIKEWKGQAVVVRAMDNLKDTYPDLVCLLIGDVSDSSESYVAHVQRLIRELGLADRVLLTGKRDNVADYVNALDVLLHASVLPEPFGRVVLEGMALRKPVIASNAGGIPEIVDDNRTGLLFVPGDDADLARCISTVLRDSGSARRMGEAGYQRLVERFGIVQHVQQIQRLYSQVLRV